MTVPRQLAAIAALALVACYAVTSTPPPASFSTKETPPPLLFDPAHPLAAVIWTLNYDMRRFDDVWAWLNDAVPAGGEQARALGAAAMAATAELGRRDLASSGVAAFGAAIAAFPDDARLPMWQAYLHYLDVRDSADPLALLEAFEALRATAQRYPAFNLFGFTLAVGSQEASAALVEEAHAALERVISATASMQFATDVPSIARSRRLWDTPIAPYSVEGTEAMIGDMALRAGKPDLARRAYYTATHSDAAYRWPWRAEVQRRLDQLDQVAAGLAAHPATEFSFGSHFAGAMGVATEPEDTHFGGRVGNGSCTICHTHLTTFDNPALFTPAVGWIRGRFVGPEEVPNPQPVFVALASTDANAVPAGFALGPPFASDGPRDFDVVNGAVDTEFVIPAAPGSYFVGATLAGNSPTGDSLKYGGYSAKELGQPWFITVRAGTISDIRSHVIDFSKK